MSLVFNINYMISPDVIFQQVVKAVRFQILNLGALFILYVKNSYIIIHITINYFIPGNCSRA